MQQQASLTEQFFERKIISSIMFREIFRKLYSTIKKNSIFKKNVRTSETAACDSSSLLEKCPNTEFFWSVFWSVYTFRVVLGTECFGNIQNIPRKTSMMKCYRQCHFATDFFLEILLKFSVFFSNNTTLRAQILSKPVLKQQNDFSKFLFQGKRNLIF